MGEIHLAGHAVNDADGQTILIDDHGAPVSDAVWASTATPWLALARCLPLIEWDANIPELAVLCAEAHTAERFFSVPRRRANAGVA